jgi:hypothetical protein
LVFLLDDDEFWDVTRELWNAPDEAAYPLDKMWITHAVTDDDWSLLVVRDEGGSGEQSCPLKVNAASEFRLRLEPGAYFLLLRVGEDADARVPSRRRFEIRRGEETNLDVTRR